MRSKAQGKFPADWSLSFVRFRIGIFSPTIGDGAPLSFESCFPSNTPIMNRSLLEKPILLLDGGLGTTLEDEHEVKFSTQTPLWSSHLLVENTDTLKTVQRHFADAGAEIILTATYQASFHGFRNTKAKGGSGIERDEALQYMLSAVRIARDAFNSRPGLVALSLGAYGATMVPSREYSGDYGKKTMDDLYEFHIRRLLCFMKSAEWKEIDIVAIETLPRLEGSEGYDVNNAARRQAILDLLCLPER